MQRRSLSLTGLCAFVASMSIALPAWATILTFNIDNFPSGTAAGTATLLAAPHFVYGDNVTSPAMTIGSFTYNYGIGNGLTPNVTVGYSLGTNANNHFYYTDGGSPPSPLWTDVDFLHGGSNPFIHYFTFVPTAPFGVTVNSFDVFGYASTAQAHTYSWNLRADTTVGTILASGGPTAFVGTIAAPSIVTTGFGGYNGTLVLEIIHTAGVGGGWGLDNLNFDQVPPLPEPSTLALLGLGAMGLAIRTRRRRAAA